MLFYIGLSGNHAESSLATMRYLPQNIRYAGDECYANQCGPNRDGQSVCQKFCNCQKCNKSCRNKKGSPKITCVGERCVGIAKSFLTQKKKMLLKLIVNKEEDSGESHSKRNKEKKGQRKRRRVYRGDDWSRRRRRRRRRTHARGDG